MMTNTSNTSGNWQFPWCTDLHCWFWCCFPMRLWM